LFGAYFLERFGEQALQVLAADSSNGLRSVDGALRTLGAGLDGNDLFADWVAANYLDDPDLPGRRYGYRDLELPPIRPQGVVDAGSLPVEIEASVGQYATDYFVLNGLGDFQIYFAGETLVRPAPAEPHSGDMVWWAGREQESDATLSRDFDLSGLERATLTFYTWYDVEEYDRAYVAVSTDGRQWMALPGQTTSAGPRLGVVLGPGYTGRSDGWVQERIDLTPYAGQQLQVRFEYVTDDGPIRPGFLLDDIEIPELGYRHDAEADDGGWSADGFLRLANSLPQEWLLQLITQRGDRVAVERLALDSENRGRWNVSLGPGETAVLVIAGLTRDTAEAAGYRLLFSMPGS
jgi:immune inhibitor A